MSSFIFILKVLFVAILSKEAYGIASFVSSNFLCILDSTSKPLIMNKRIIWNLLVIFDGFSMTWFFKECQRLNVLLLSKHKCKGTENCGRNLFFP